MFVCSHSKSATRFKYCNVNVLYIVLQAIPRCLSLALNHNFKVILYTFSVVYLMTDCIQLFKDKIPHITTI